MAKIRISTKIIHSNYIDVFSKFDATLFLKLAPPFPKVSLLRFDGCLKGDLVKINLHFPFFSQVWESEIIENGSENECTWFIDKGIKLPFFLSYWRHLHQIKQEKENVYIIDSIEFKCHNWLFTTLFYPIIYLQFLYRIPIYKALSAKQ
jgi:ligand-binding SRPBCC domain-containing protein